MCPDKKRPAGNTGVLPGGLTLYGRISVRQNRVCPCQLMVCKNENALHCCGSPFIAPGWPQYKSLHPDYQPHNFTFPRAARNFVEKHGLFSRSVCRNRAFYTKEGSPFCPFPAAKRRVLQGVMPNVHTFSSFFRSRLFSKF